MAAAGAIVDKYLYLKTVVVMQGRRFVPHTVSGQTDD